MSTRGQEGLLKPWPRSPRQWSHMRGSTAEAQASDWGRVRRRGLMKTRERGVRIRSLDYLNHYKSVSNHSNLSNHSVLLLFRERERGGPQAILFPGAFLLLFVLVLFTFVVYLQLHA